MIIDPRFAFHPSFSSEFEWNGTVNLLCDLLSELSKS